jgi:4-aminobutyrate aminotransferase-like enzyme
MEKNYTPNDTLISKRKKHFIPTTYLYHDKPLQLVKAQGTRVWDHEGNSYLDGIGGIVSISAGHNHPKIKQALHMMLESDVIQHTSMLYLTEYPVKLAEALVEETPEGVNKVGFTNSGSEANELAFMASRHATGETIIGNLRLGYHGGTSAAMAQCGHGTWRFRAQPNASTTSALAPNCYRCPFGKKPDSCSLECADHVEETIQTTTHGKIAAFIIEPIMGVGGFITPPKEYFQKVAKIVHNYGGKYISDEVQTGSGRTGEQFFYTKDLGIDADVITTAKSFGNGAPIGVAIMTSEVADPLAGKFYFNTFAGDPYPVVQAQKTMEIIREEKLIENAKRMGNRLQDGFRTMMKTQPLIGDVRGKGLLIGIELVKDKTTKTYATQETAKVMDLCKDKGLLLGKGGLHGNVLRIAPPLCITEADVDFMLKTIDESFTECQKA